MTNLLFALNTTAPIFLTILLGYFLRRIRVINESFNKTANNYIFKCALPLSLFQSVAAMDLGRDFDLRFCFFCIAVTIVMFSVIWALSFLLIKDKSQIGAFAQASARSSGAVLGFAFSTAIYGNIGMVPMMIVAAVPFFNMFSVCILCLSPHYDENGVLVSTGESGAIKNALINVAKNPLILSIVIALPFALFRIKFPAFVNSAISSVAATATPLALIVLGAAFSGSEALTRWKGAAISSVIKLFILPAVFLPIAVMMGFTGPAMVAILILVGSPTTISCYVMAKSMHGDEVLTSNAILLSTLLSSVSITMWLYLLRSFTII